MRDIDYLKLLSEKYRSESSVQAEIINRKALLSLPKGNEYFFSDIHGEYEGCMECHLQPDWLLVWEKHDEELQIIMVTTGSHSDIFGKKRR